MKATLLLSDKTRWKGEAFGSPGIAIGYVTYHTGDYMDFCSDPACANQLIFPSTPMVGMLGVNIENGVTGKPWLSGLILREICDKPMHWRSAEKLSGFLRRHFITAITGLDTRSLLSHITENGPFRAAICANPDFRGWDALVAKLNGSTMNSPYPGAARNPVTYECMGDTRAHAGLIDLGCSTRLTQALLRDNIKVTRVPPTGNWQPDDYDLWTVSHGARENGHDAGLVAKIKTIVNAGKPLWAIGNGFSLLCQAMDIPMKPTRLGFHGDDYAVLNKTDGTVLLTSQNHRQSLTLQSDESNDVFFVTHRNISDGSCVGFTLRNRPVHALQFQLPIIFPQEWKS
jgi:carbamoyl-phosphate synthase small subunit